MAHIEIGGEYVCCASGSTSRGRSNKNATLGSVTYEDDGRLFLMTETGWTRIESCPTNFSDAAMEILYPKTCHRCGAPLVGHKCEYCGTEYGGWENGFYI